MSLRARLGLALAVAAALSVLAPLAAWMVWHKSESQRLEAHARESLQHDLNSQIGRWHRQLEGGLAVATRLMAGAANGGHDAVPLRFFAADTLRAAGLDLLWLLDEEGRIRACGHWAARAGSDGRTLMDVSENVPQVHELVVGDEDMLGLLQARSLRLGNETLKVVAGVDLRRVIRAAAPATAMTTLALIGASETSAGGSMLPGGELVTRGMLTPESSSWLVEARRPLPAPGTRLSLAVLMVLVFAAALLAGCAGVWLTRRALRPMEDLNQMAAALAGGHLDVELDNEDGDALGGLADSFNRMIRSLRRQRQELETTARIAAWRDAARRLAHEVKNPLAPIRMSVENLKHARTRAPERFDDLFTTECRTILDEVDALTRLVDTFSRFARLPEPQCLPTSVLEPLHHVLHLHQDAVSGVRLVEVAGPDPGLADMDAGQVGQVLKNLVLNAVAAAPPSGGLVEMACGGDDTSVHYTVRDNGPGIPAALRRTLFEPQVTARPGGSGLGLAVCRQIVQAHAGRIDFTTGAGGTCFTVTLPRRSSGTKGV